MAKDRFIRFSDDEASKMLDELANQERRSIGNTVAIAIRNEHARVFGKVDLQVKNSPQIQAAITSHQ